MKNPITKLVVDRSISAINHSMEKKKIIRAKEIEAEQNVSIEQIKSSKLWKMQKYYGMKTIFITPHIGGACWDSLYKCELFLIDKLIHELENR